MFGFFSEQRLLNLPYKPGPSFSSENLRRTTYTLVHELIVCKQYRLEKQVFYLLTYNIQKRQSEYTMKTELAKIDTRGYWQTTTAEEKHIDHVPNPYILHCL